MLTSFQNSINEIKRILQAGHFQDALSLLHQLKNDKCEKEQKVELLYLEAVVHRYNQHLNEAQASIQILLDIKPEYGRAYQEQGYCFLASQDLDLALQSFHKAIEYNPSLIASLQKIVELFKQRAHVNYPVALHQYNILKSLPTQVLAAMDLMHEGKLHKAEQICRKYLLQHKHQPDAMCLLAEIGLKLKVFDDAEFLLESCVNLYPDNEHAKVSYIVLLNRLGKFKQGVNHALEYLAQFSNNSGSAIAVKSTLANCYINLGDIGSGIDIYQTILSDHPDKTGIKIQLGHAYKTSGDLEKAVTAYQDAYKIGGNNGDAFWSLANIKTYRFKDAELEKMKLELNNAKATSSDQIYINFALGKAYEDSGNYEKSFQYYTQGNELKSRTLHYDAKNTNELIEQQIKYCTHSLFNQRNNTGLSDSAPIFILGLPRAGSTLVEQIIASHSQVDGTIELHNILGIALSLRGRIVNGESQYPQNLWDIPDKKLNELGEKYIRDTQHYRKGAPFFIDKMPNNFIHIGLIKMILPKAIIIDARREPMACCFSGYKQLFGEGQEFSYNLSDIAQYYKDYERLMAHWDDVMPGSILRVQHEDLVNNVEYEVKRILAFCGLPFEQNCIEFYNTKRNIHTPSAEQVRKPISRQGIEQWKNYSPYLNELVSALNDA